MFPLRDNVQRRTIPFVNIALIGINAYVFAVELGQGKRLTAFVTHYGLVPAAWTSRAFAASAPDALSQLVTSMFLHGGWMHILSNMWCLYLFGNSVEDAMGHLRYLLFYLMAGVFAGLVQLATHLGSPVPTIGASGAIAGIMGGYFLLFPKAKISTVVPVFFLPLVVDVSAFIFLLLWFWSQLYSGLFGLGANFGGIAWWAHIGGFVAGMYWLKRLKPKKRP
ncbi:MAG: rhomboid family intramembrane serine protease [Elusimicrobia bacterium]|nr:rhomboid family intramembrane serine protease [Elusimicrobiota bacterium]